MAGQSEDFAIARIKGDNRSVVAFQHLFRHRLQTDVDAQINVLTGGRRGTAQYPQRSAFRVGFDLLPASAPAQHIFVRGLHADLADVGAAAVLAGIKPAQLVFINPPDIADHMRATGSQRIATGQVGLDVYAG